MVQRSCSGHSAGRLHDQVRVEAGLRLADASGRPFADEGDRPGRWQRADRVTPVPVTPPATETLQIQRNTGESGTLVQLRPAPKFAAFLPSANCTPR